MTLPCPTSTYCLSFGSCHPWVPPLALWPLRKEAKPLSLGTDLAVLVVGRGCPQLEQKLTLQISHFCHLKASSS